MNQRTPPIVRDQFPFRPASLYRVSCVLPFTMTSDGTALFHALCENPADDTPRLVFADWLEENNQPERAEFIRLQCEAWNLCPAYPTVTAARTRASELLKQFGDQWYDDLPVLEGVTWGNLFIRGFVDAAWITAGRDIRKRLTMMFEATPLEHLTLVGFNHRARKQLAGLRYLKRLKTLH